MRADHEKGVPRSEFEQRSRLIDQKPARADAVEVRVAVGWGRAVPLRLRRQCDRNADGTESRGGLLSSGLAGLAGLVVRRTCRT